LKLTNDHIPSHTNAGTVPVDPVHGRVNSCPRSHPVGGCIPSRSPDPSSDSAALHSSRSSKIVLSCSSSIRTLRSRGFQRWVFERSTIAANRSMVAASSS
jgi:hypothetical protein